MPPSEWNPEDYLQRFGLESFRPAQRDVIEAVLAGEDCLCIMPTGGGKSLCYQLPAIMMDGLTLVVSPLIALMKDQVDGLKAKGIKADFINSTLNSADQYERLNRLAAGYYDLLYVAPERFRSRRFVEILKAANLRLLAIDEAHCISEWGHDFRPDYARLGQYRRRIGNPPTIALTATATVDVQHDVIEQLQLSEPRAFVAGFARENLHYRVVHHTSRSDKDATIQLLAKQNSGPGIIYVSTRKLCGEVAELLHTEQRRVGYYHGGLEPAERRSVQDRFMADEIDIVVATNAFGMGIDKPDVRFVAHYNMPGTLEAYYQEAGRAGRDGEPSECVLLYGPADLRIQRYFIESAYPDRSVVRLVYEYLRNLDQDPVEITQQELRERLQLDISQDGVGTCERLLEKSGIMQRLEPHRNMAVVQVDSDVYPLVDLISTKARNARKVIQVIESFVGDSRYEPVYVQLQNVAQRTALSSAAVRKALMELNQLDAFQYVPPFRGRAIHLTRRDVPFEKVDIDFASMDRRKKLDYDKLDRMVGYAHTGGCRQRNILDYFGDPSAEDCTNCDNCHGTDVASNSQEPVRLSSDDTVKTVARIALSGVARTDGRIGKTAIAGMLCGSRSTKMKKLRLDRLSTFGRLDELKQSEVVTLLDALLRVGWLEQFEIDRHRPLVRLTQRGREIMLDKTNTDDHLVLPRRLVKRIRVEFEPDSPPVPRGDAAQPSASLNVRQTATSAPNHEEPYRATKIHDMEELDELPSYSPTHDFESQSAAEPTAVDEVATSIQPTQPDDSRTKLANDSGDKPPDSASPPTYYWTWRLVNDGMFPIDEIIAIRRIDSDEFWNHLQQAANDGRHIELKHIVNSRVLVALDNALDQAAVTGVARPPDELLRELQEEFPAVEPAGIGLFLKCRLKCRSSD